MGDVGVSPEERAAAEREIADLERKAAKRRGEPGFAANVQLIAARIAELKAALSAS